MKKIALALILLCCGLSAAEIYPLNGDYRYNENPQLIQSMQIEVVRLYRAIDQERLQELRRSGFTCELVASKTARCRRIEKNATLPPQIKARIEKRWQGELVSFGFLRAQPSVLYKGESYTEFEVPQNITVGRDTWSEYRYFESDELHKIQTGLTAPAAHSFVVNSSDEIELVVLEAASTPTGYFSYMIAVPFVR